MGLSRTQQAQIILASKGFDLFGKTIFDAKHPPPGFKLPPDGVIYEASQMIPHKSVDEIIDFLVPPEKPVIAEPVVDYVAESVAREKEALAKARQQTVNSAKKPGQKPPPLTSERKEPLQLTMAQKALQLRRRRVEEKPEDKVQPPELVALRKRRPSERALAYRDKILSGEMSTCKSNRACVEFYSRGMEDPEGIEIKGKRYVWVPEIADEFVRFAEEYIYHKEGELFALPFTYQEWQCWNWSMKYAWLEAETGYRRFRTCYTHVPRKNGKTAMGGAGALALSAIDGAPGSKIFIAASHYRQAMIGMNFMWRQCEKGSALSDTFFLKAFGSDRANSKITQFVDEEEMNKARNGKETGTVIEPVSQDSSGNLDGTNPKLGWMDELHAHETDKTYNAFLRGTTGQREWLMDITTTAGDDRTGICRERYGYAKKVIDGAVTDATFFSQIFEIDDPEQWDNPEAYRDCNPNYEVSIYKENIEIAIQEAQNSPAMRVSLLQKQCNYWAESANTWISGNLWQSRERELSWEELAAKGWPCWIAADMSKTQDTTAICYLFEDPDPETVEVEQPDGTTKKVLAAPRLYAKWRVYLPQKAIDDKRNVLYPRWVSEGDLIAMPGPAIIQNDLVQQIEDDCKVLNVQGIAADRMQAQAMLQHFSDNYGIDCIEVNQGGKTWQAAGLQLQHLMVTSDIVFDENGCVRWMATNAIVKDAEKPEPKKPSQRAKVDALHALLTAMVVKREVKDTDDETILEQDEKIVYFKSMQELLEDHEAEQEQEQDGGLFKVV